MYRSAARVHDARECLDLQQGFGVSLGRLVHWNS